MGRTSRVITSAAAFMVLAGSALAQVADEDFSKVLQERQAQWNALRAENNLNWETVVELNRQTLAKLDVANLSTDQLQQLFQRSGLIGVFDNEALRNRLDELMEAPGKDGVMAMLLVMQVARQAGEEDRANEIAQHLLEHPALGEIVGTDDVGGLLRALSSLVESDPKGYERVAKFILSLPETMTPRGVMSLRSTVAGLAGAVTDDTRDLHGTVLAKVMSLTEGAMADADERTKKSLERTLAFYKGPFARGELIGGPMPKLDVIWASDPTVTSMDAYQGKVLVLDFWATWCGPCIHSFPNIRHVAEHYEGYPVAIVGVTSLQGASYNGPTGEAIKTEGEPEKEFELMKEFMEYHDMNWDVVFTKQDCFNPDFGVTGIPHMAIVDAGGKVRYNGLHPAGISFEEKTRMIDELLREAGFEPPPPAEESGHDEGDGHDHDGG